MARGLRAQRSVPRCHVLHTGTRHSGQPYSSRPHPLAVGHLESEQACQQLETKPASAAAARRHTRCCCRRRRCGGCTCGLRKTFVRIEMFLLSTPHPSGTMEWRGRVCLTMKALPRRKASRTRKLAFLTSPRFGARLPAFISDSQWLSGRRCALCSGAWLPMPAASSRPAR